jgi:hypothetical protein
MQVQWIVLGWSSCRKVNAMDGPENDELRSRERRRWLDAIFIAMIVISVTGLVYILFYR